MKIFLNIIVVLGIGGYLLTTYAILTGAPIDLLDKLLLVNMLGTTIYFIWECRPWAERR